MSKKPKVKRSIELKGLDKTLKLSKVTSINLTEIDKEFIYLELLNDDTWRLTYTSKTIPDIAELESLNILRDN